VSYQRLLNPKLMLFIPLLMVLAVIALACGGSEDATSTPRAEAQATPTTRAAEPEKEAAIATAAPQPTATPGTAELPGVSGGVMTLMVPYTPSHFNPDHGGWLPAAWISPMYSELVHYNPETADPLDIRGDLADTWEVSNGGKTFTFYLNEDAAWHDGTPVTAADIVFTFEDIVDPDKARPWRGVIRPYYESATAINDHTVQVNLKYAAAAFFPYLAIDYMQMLPKHQFDKGLDMDLHENRMGSGPFRLTEYEPDISLEYERNTEYWKPGLPYLDGLKMFILSSPASVMAAHRTGQILMSHTMVTWMTNAEALQLDEQMRGQGEGAVFWAGPASHTNLFPNLQREPFTDKRVRQAMHLAVHRQPIMQIVTRGQATLGWPFAPNYWFSPTNEEVAQLPGYRETADGEKHPDDIAEAKRLMEEAGFPDGFKTDMMVPAGGLDVKEFAQVASDQLRRTLNIDIDLDPQERAVLDPRRNSRDFEFYAGSQGLLIIDPEDMYSRMYLEDAFSNYGQWVPTPRFLEIFDEQSREQDRERRRELTFEAADIFFDQLPNIPLYYVIRPMFISTTVQNFNISPTAYSQNYKMEHIWCDPECSPQ
jgi:peptide/nickel transport system substrate-binding protein